MTRILHTLLAAAFALASGAASAQSFTMKLSSPTINDTQHEYMKALKAGVETRTGGRVKVEIYPANQLGQIPRTVEGVTLGTVELTAPTVGFFAGLEPRFEVLEMPGLFDDVRHAQRVLSDPEVRSRLAGFGAAKGIEPLYCFMNGPLMLLSHKPVKALDDLKGQKIRVPGATPSQVEPMRKLGASPLSMPLGEALPAMQNKTIDGLAAAQVVFTAFKYHDIAKTLTALPKSFAAVCGVVNRNFMKSLGPELEAAVRDEARKAEAVFVDHGPREVETTRKTWEANGGQIVTLPAADAQRYVDEVTSTVKTLMANRPQFKDDLDALQAAAAKARP